MPFVVMNRTVRGRRGRRRLPSRSGAPMRSRHPGDVALVREALAHRGGGGLALQSPAARCRVQLARQCGRRRRLGIERGVAEQGAGTRRAGSPAARSPSPRARRGRTPRSRADGGNRRRRARLRRNAATPVGRERQQQPVRRHRRQALGQRPVDAECPNLQVRGLRVDEQRLLAGRRPFQRVRAAVAADHAVGTARIGPRRRPGIRVEHVVPVLGSQQRRLGQPSELVAHRRADRAPRHRARRTARPRGGRSGANCRTACRRHRTAAGARSGAPSRRRPARAGSAGAAGSAGGAGAPGRR